MPETPAETPPGTPPGTPRAAPSHETRSEAPEFQRRQLEFAAHIRDPETAPAPAGVEDRRMAIYRELFFSNLSNLLGSTFRITRKLLGEPGWRALIREFMARHESHTPLFLEVPEEFLGFLEHERGLRDGDPGFLLELAHYEWVELALSVAPDPEGLETIDRDGGFETAEIVLSPLAWPLAYRYPVHRISPDYRPASPPEQPTYLVVYRRLDDELGFMELNAVTARLLELVRDNETGATGGQLLAQLAAELAHPQPDAVVRGGLDSMRELRRLDILLGTRIPEAQRA